MCIRWALAIWQEWSESWVKLTEHLPPWPHGSPRRTANPIPCRLSSSRPYTCLREEATCTLEGGHLDTMTQRQGQFATGLQLNNDRERPCSIERQERNWSFKSLGTDLCSPPFFPFYTSVKSPNHKSHTVHHSYRMFLPLKMSESRALNLVTKDGRMLKVASSLTSVSAFPNVCLWFLNYRKEPALRFLPWNIPFWSRASRSPTLKSCIEK